MIILINGAFGVGKTTVARLLLSELPNSMLYDPEIVGTCVRYLTAEVHSGIEATDDFQDIKIWRSLTIYTAQQLYHRYQRSLVIPMTLANKQYFREIITGLTAVAEPLHHFCLLASPITIHERLVQRGNAPQSWAFQQTQRCLEAFTSPLFQEFVDAETQTPAEIVTHILHRVQNVNTR